MSRKGIPVNVDSQDPENSTRANRSTRPRRTHPESYRSERLRPLTFWFYQHGSESALVGMGFGRSVRNSLDCNSRGRTSGVMLSHVLGGLAKNVETVRVTTEMASETYQVQKTLEVSCRGNHEQTYNSKLPNCRTPSNGRKVSSW